MNEMIERVAKAIHIQRNSTPQQQAIAAIKAMREPTEAMGEAPYRVEGYYQTEELQLAGWQAMIDEALSDGTPNISPELDNAIQDELDHPPKSIMNED